MERVIMKDIKGWPANRERMLRDFLDIISVDSPSLKERKMADALRAKLAETGMAVYEDDAGAAAGGECGNIIGVLPAFYGGARSSGDTVSDGGARSSGGGADAGGGARRKTGVAASAGAASDGGGACSSGDAAPGRCTVSVSAVSDGGGAGSAPCENAINLPVVALLAHMDTVEPCTDKKWEIEGDIIRSRGDTILGGDDAAGIAASLEIVRRLREEGVRHGGVMIILTIAEEFGLLGAKYLDHDFIKRISGGGFPKHCFVFDSGSPPGSVVARAPSHSDVIITVRGTAAHAGIEPEKGVNAISILSRAIADMPLGRLDFETTANIGIIRGGRARNVVCDTAVAEGEARSHNPEKLRAQIAKMEECVAAACENANVSIGATTSATASTSVSASTSKTASTSASASASASTHATASASTSATASTSASASTPELAPSYDFEEIASYKSFCLTGEDEIIRLLAGAAQNLGYDLELVTTGGGSDANVLNEMGIPAANLPVGMHAVHGVNEYTDLRETAETVELVVEAFKLLGES
jgi:peptidase T-like protein